jgi:molybdopterin-containing oxidoreductase family iron-sulfur binding subunit
VLLIDANDPAYTLPGGVGFEAALKHVPTRVSFATFPDDTALLCTHVLPDHHFLEAWDDYVPRPGTVELVQPTMRPVFNTKQVGDVLLTVARLLGNENVTPGFAAATYFDYLRANWAATHGVSGDAWREAVKRGGLSTGAATAAPAAPAAVAAAAMAQPAATNGATAPVEPVSAQPLDFESVPDANFHLVVYPSYRFFDGRTGNRPWLLELPDPVTKVPWDSFIELHPRAAEQLGVKQGENVEVTSPYGSVVGPVYIYPGVRDDVVAIQTGLGKKAFGRFNDGRGINPNVLLGAAALGATGDRTAGVRESVKKTTSPSMYLTGVLKSPPKMFEQGVRVQHDRNLAQAVSVATLAARDAKGPGAIPGSEDTFAPLKGAGGFAPVETTTDPGAYPGPGTHFGQYIEKNTRWAMTIDLSRCIGCSACVIACNAENNVPVVGPDEMRKGRELHWLRIERYWGVSRDKSEAYQDNATDDTRFLPMLCQHCGNAPCEPVCPVYAAYHTPDGLNAQVYNRCVGTRYCANNCPYKVRVFNWFSYQFPVPLNWQLNPDVTVRDKGVMEKCTFCVQRIHEAERGAAVERRPVRDGEVVPACVQTCPTQVFTFGNIQDPESAVAKAARSNRSYRALDEINVQPAIVYLQKVTLHEPKHGGDMAAESTGTPSGGTPEAAAPAAAH